MKNKTTMLASGVALMALSALVAFSNTAKAGPNDRELPAEDDIFWQVTSAMTTPTDTAACQAKINEMAADGTLTAYINTDPYPV